MTRLDSKRSLLLLATILFSSAVFAQALPWLYDPPAQAGQPLAASREEASTLPLTMAPEAATTVSPSTVTIPAGTRVLMVLTSPLHTTSGTAGSGLYLETLYPVIQGNRVVIPAHTLVQGVVEADRRPGHLNRVSEFRFHFTTLIFPNNYVAPIQGALQSIPGARNIRTRDEEGTLKPVDQTEKVVTPAVAGGVGGAIIGSHRAYGIGLLPGAGLGAALGLGAVLLKRGDEISLPQGSNVEMVLQAPLSLEPAQVAANARYIPQRQPPPAAPPPTCATTNRGARQRAGCQTSDQRSFSLPGGSSLWPFSNGVPYRF
jgi:hypothetical protein